MVRIARRYTEDFKQEAIKLALKSPNVDSTAVVMGHHELQKSYALKESAVAGIV